jgi:hypothetical protein
MKSLFFVLLFFSLTQAIIQWPFKNQKSGKKCFGSEKLLELKNLYFLIDILFLKGPVSFRFWESPPAFPVSSVH